MFQRGNKICIGRIPWNKDKINIYSEETKRKMSEAHKGKHHTGEVKKKMSIVHFGHIGWNKDIPMSEKTIEKMSKAKKGKKNPNWRGGINPLNNMIRTSFKSRQWRSDVFMRDEFTCRKCGQIGGKLHAHHIKSYSSIIQYYEITDLEEALNCEELWNINNGITYCEECHREMRKK